MIIGKMKKILLCFAILPLITSCGKSSAGKAVTVSTTFLSSSLSARGASAGLNQAVHPCPSGTHTCFSPKNFSGKVITTQLRVTSGGSLTSLKVIDGGSLDSNVTSTSKLGDFDFLQALAISGTPTSTDFGASGAYKDVLIYFDYVDVTFTNAGIGVATEQTVRIAYATDDAKGYVRGDILLKVGADFKWCPTTATTTGDCTLTRPASPLVNAEVKNYVESGSPVIPYFSTEVFLDATGKGLVTVAYSSLIAKSWTYAIDFDGTDSIAVPNGVYANIFAVMPALLIRGMSPHVKATGSGMAGILTATGK